MPARLLEGKVVAEGLKAAIKAEIGSLKSKTDRTPYLAAVQIGDNVSSAVYVSVQKKLAVSLGINYELKALSADSSQADAENLIRRLNQDAGVSAIILQLPVPKNIDHRKIAGLIAPEKDAEGMHPYNLGKVILGNYTVGPCTAMAAMALLDSVKADLYGKEAVVIGHSEIVGKPLAMLLLSKFATTTVCHIATGERGVLADHVKRAEVLVAAVGKAGLIKGEWIRPGAIVIDIGINKTGDRIVGDVEFEAAKERASFITPVPGGIGPLTTTILMRNVLELFKKQIDG